MRISNTLAEELTKELMGAFREGYLAGFGATGEGWNGEYPFNYCFENQERFEKVYKESLEQYIEAMNND